MDTTVLSVGIDIGTTTTGMIVSRLGFSNTATSWSVPRVDITEKKVLYRSSMYFTPMLDETHLDGEAIRQLIAEEYRKAGVEPGAVESGAVIITGESALKENADAVTSSLSQFAGEFVVATAGPQLESLIAGKGAGAQQYSKDRGCTVVNLDIGGGTTNIAAFCCGEEAGLDCLHIGGRLLRYDKTGGITYVSPWLKALTKPEGYVLKLGMTVTAHRMGHLTDLMVRELEKSIQAYPANCCLSFSGGVGDCFYSREGDVYRYGDLGVSLAHSIQYSSLTESYTVIQPRETIRATVVGAGIYTTVVSGSTITYSDHLFPLKNIPAFQAGENAERMAFRGSSKALTEELRWFTNLSGEDTLLMCFRGEKKVTYEELCNLARSIGEASREILPETMPLLVLTEQDMAKSLGQTLQRYLKETEKREIVCIDKIKTQPGDYVDIGRPLMNGLAVPVVVKTLIFQ